MGTGEILTVAGMAITGIITYTRFEQRTSDRFEQLQERTTDAEQRNGDILKRMNALEDAFLEIRTALLGLPNSGNGIRGTLLEVKGLVQQLDKRLHDLERNEK